MKAFSLLLGIPKAAVCFALECVTIPTGITLEAMGAKKLARKLEVTTLKLDRAAGKAVGKIVVILIVSGALSSCQLCEGLRQFDPDYTPRESR